MAYFGNNQQCGELQELYAYLNDLNFEKKQEVLLKKLICYQDCKESIASMTSRERCVTIFEQFIKHRDDKLAIILIPLQRELFLIKTRLWLSKISAKMFVNQKIHSIRTFGCIRVFKLNEYLIKSFKDCIQDDDRYVHKKKQLLYFQRKYCFGKFILSMREVEVVNGKQLIQLSPKIKQKLLLIFILYYLATYDPVDQNQLKLLLKEYYQDQVLSILLQFSVLLILSSIYQITLIMEILVKNLCKKISLSLIYQFS
ncbi:unnamed protein product [Paramecium octaurelia]|uniref:Transmembrane protein n=1 Tax=Paramecium octaurelia TaxID=43137 RepID=A0A8S1UII2_PAROT|nr:unnamed protein product [Paramecium octaurelia]